MKKVWKIIGICFLVIVCALLCGIGYLTAAEYKPEEAEAAPAQIQKGNPVPVGQPLTIITWNTGYAGLSKEADFFMDGGSMVLPTSQAVVEENLSAISQFLGEEQADLYFLQEVDRNSKRTDYVDQLAYYEEQTGLSWAYGVNYRCAYVPYPFPTLGKMECGNVTLSALDMEENAVRVSLPCPFTWPVRVANMKRCLLVTRHQLEGTDRELVTVNLHLEAYDDGEGKIAQTKKMLQILEEEYAKGNYVIAGGDFNQSFPGMVDIFPIRNNELWQPSLLDPDALGEGWQYLYDSKTPSCRLLNKAYDLESPDTQYYVIDGFIISPNVTVVSVETMDLRFENADHNPVKAELILEP